MRPLGSWQSAVFLLNSRLGLLTAAPASPVSLCAEASLFPRLRDYFAEFLNVVSLAHLGLLDPSTCVGLRYGPARPDATTAFLGSAGTGFASASPPRLPLARPPLPAGGPAIASRHRLRSRAGRRNVRLPPIGYALRPRLRTRLTLGGRTWPRNPRICGGRDSHPPFRYSCLHGRPHALHGASRRRFAAHAALSYQLRRNLRKSAASAARFSPDHFRRRVSRPVSCYAIFKWWLPLSQHPGCHRDPASLQSTKRAIRGLGRRSGLFPSRPRSLSPAV